MTPGEQTPQSLSSLLQWIDAYSHRLHRKANHARILCLSLKASQLLLAGSIPVIALLNPSASKPALNGILGALIVIIEGFQHSFKFEQFWIRYRRAGFDLQAEKRLFEMRAGPYENVANPTAALAVRTNEIDRDRATDWANTIQKALSKSN